MVLEAASRLSSCQVPQAQGLVPWSRQGVVSVRWQNNVADEVAVAIETLLGHTIAVSLAQQAPHDQSLVCKNNSSLKKVMLRCRKLTQNFLPRDDDKIMSGYLGFVAIWVTHPEWPIKVPFNCKVSVILLVELNYFRSSEVNSLKIRRKRTFHALWSQG